GWPAPASRRPSRRGRRPDRDGGPSPRPSPPPGSSAAAGRRCRPRRWGGRSGGSSAPRARGRPRRPGPGRRGAARRNRTPAGLRAKAPIALVAEIFGTSDWQAGPGDDGAVVDAGGATVVVGGEAMLPSFVAADPFAAGVAAMLTNVNDLAAMGAEPLALVDTVVASEAVARRALEGLHHASGLYRVPVVGGHLTIHDGPPALSAFGLGR